MLKSYFLFILFLSQILISCKNEEVMRPRQQASSSNKNTIPSINQDTTAPKPPANTAPNVFAGADIYLVLPLNSCALKGSAQYAESIHHISWKKISGPASFAIETPSSVETKVYNLEKGAYVFELSITNKEGLTGRDSIFVTVLEEGTGENERIFKDLKWSCPMGCHLRIENIYTFIPAGTAFKVYLKRDNSTVWIEAMNGSYAWSKYMWTIYNNGLEILEDQTENPEDTPDVKITF